MRNCTINSAPLVTKGFFLIGFILLAVSLYQKFFYFNNRHYILSENHFDTSIVQVDSDEHYQTLSLYKNDEWALDDANIPPWTIILGNNTAGPQMYNESCAKYPNLDTVKFNNIFWQIQNTDAEEYYFYSAFLDIRASPTSEGNSHNNTATVRVIAMCPVSKMKVSNSSLKICQYWFENQVKPMFGNVIDMKMLWPFSSVPHAHYYPYIITCEFPVGIFELPVAVSIVPYRCSNATNNLKIHHVDRINRTINPDGFAVCVKALDFPNANMQWRLLEWIETLRLVGAEKIFLNEYFVHPEVKRLLDYYESNGVIGVTHTALPGELPNQAQLRHLFVRMRISDKRMIELIAYNDCFYKNMYDYEYIALLDIDEIILPNEDIKWSELVKKIRKVDLAPETFGQQPLSTICFQNHLYFDEMLKGRENEVSSIPPELYMLRHVYRGEEPTWKKALKCFHSTHETVGLHNHYAFYCRHIKGCVRHYVDVKRGQMNHYRSICPVESLNCTNFISKAVQDTKLWRYKDKIMNRAKIVLNNLNIPSSW